MQIPDGMETAKRPQSVIVQSRIKAVRKDVFTPMPETVQQLTEDAFRYEIMNQAEELTRQRVQKIVLIVEMMVNTLLIEAIGYLPTEDDDSVVHEKVVSELRIELLERMMRRGASPRKVG